MILASIIRLIPVEGRIQIETIEREAERSGGTDSGDGRSAVLVQDYKKIGKLKVDELVNSGLRS